MMRAARSILVLVLLSAGLADAADTPAPDAAALLDQGRFQEAEAALRAQGAKAEPGALARSVAGQGRYAEAAKLHAAELAARGEKPDPRAQYGWWSLAAAWKSSPEALAHHARGFWLVGQQRWAEAQRELEAALAADPRLADASYHLGYAREMQGDAAGAERAYRAAIAGYGPADRVLQASAQYNLGNLLASRGPAMAQEAVTLLRAASAEDGQGRQPYIVYSLGQTCLAVPDLPCARAAFAEVAERTAPGADFPADALSVAQDHLYAAGCAPRPPGAAPGQPPACAGDAAVAAEQAAVKALNDGDAAAALKQFDAALAASTSFAKARYGRGVALLALQRPGEAELELGLAIASAGYASRRVVAAMQANLALALVKRGAPGPTAVRLALASAWVAGDEVAARTWHQLLLGRAFAATGNRACAVEHFDNVLALPGVSDAAAARARELKAEVEKAHPDARPDCFRYEVYEEATVGGTWRAFRRDHPADAAKVDHTVQLHPAQWRKVRVRLTGARRPLGEVIAYMFREGAGMPMGVDITWRELGKRYAHEVEIEEEGARHWLPMQEVLLPFLDKELPRGGTADLYALFLGGIDGQPLLIVNEFEAVPEAKGAR